MTQTMIRGTQQGFTLVEAVIVIVITGVIAAVVAVFIRSPVEGYLDAARRAELTDTADTALRRIARDLRLALPNSVRISGQAIEFLSTREGGRYRAERDNTGGGNVLDITANVTQFDALGPAITLVAGDQIVIYNQDTPDAYAGTNRRAYDGAGGAGNTVAIDSVVPFPMHSPSRRFHVVDAAVTYICDAGSLWRYWGYPIQPQQDAVDTVAELDVLAAPASATRGRALVAQNVTGCLFSYAQGVTERSGIVTMQITLAQEGETVTLYHAVHVTNAP
jgi:MSHA biogenesis protein MshO